MLDLFDMPIKKIGKDDRVDGAKLAGRLRGYCGTAVIERVGYIGSGGGDKNRRDGGKGAFSFGESAGGARCVLEALGYEMLMPRPQDWRKWHGLTGADDYVVIQTARDLYPEANVYTGGRKRDGTLGIKDGRTDALLIARYGLSKNGSEKEGS
ncbi:hypothetical protein ACRS3X_07710 [Ectopseudomonas hydrolytica]|uniref:hypothetical protein n=1 Tax=Ectopseudomonas hydrolytica TaxID=2493633 RepID=UPI003EE2757B